MMLQTLLAIPEAWVATVQYECLSNTVRGIELSEREDPWKRLAAAGNHGRRRPAAPFVEEQQERGVNDEDEASIIGRTTCFTEGCPGCAVEFRKISREGLPAKELSFLAVITLANCISLSLSLFLSLAGRTTEYLI
ncbi:hypothetical protein KP509_11G095700 [Ceratopteris richardii]|uniref:Uncharacterized protein n=1 Tax=Ceratopteris richardii TaxID=49495 RepID=A0A8T2TXK2_CERRI|nr:hypothetical protein KP509_11G095700 [Ceratopteris richardii]